MIAIYKNAQGLLSTRLAQAPEKEILIQVKACFPWSRGKRFLSLQDDKGEEVCLLASLDDLDSQSLHVMREHLQQLGFTFEIIKIIKVEEDVEVRHFAVETLQGERHFQTGLDDWPKQMEDGSLLISDLHGDHYQVSSFALLDRESQKELSPYVS